MWFVNKKERDLEVTMASEETDVIAVKEEGPVKEIIDVVENAVIKEDIENSGEFCDLQGASFIGDDSWKFNYSFLSMTTSEYSVYR